MGLWNGFIVILNLRWWLASQALIGSTNYHGFCSVPAPYPKRTSNVHRRRWCMERHWLFRAISCRVVRTQTTLRSSYRETVRKLAPRPPVPHGTKPSSVPTALIDSRFVFVRRDSHRPPLTPPNEGPYKVLVHGDKSFVLDYGTRQYSVSIGRLKPAFVDPMTPIEAAKRAPRGRPPTGVETRSGGLVRPPERYISR